MKKLSLTMIGIIILSACSSLKHHDNKQKETVHETEIVVPKTLQIKEKPTPNKISVLKGCSNCYNVNNMKHYFDSINYARLSKTKNLIINKISKNLFQSEDINLKKEVFFKSIYPLVYQVNKEIKAEQKDIAKYKNLVPIMQKYGVKNIADLKARVNTIPASIFLAQAAIESAYGTSRFAEEGNALFGQWTTDPNGITPREKTNSIWKVARFDTPLDSARAYALNINTHNSYKGFRELRSRGLNPVNGLYKYSQKGTDYIDLVNSVIKSNNLNKYN